MEFYAVEPFGEERADQRSAALGLYLAGVLKDHHNTDLSLIYPYFPDSEVLMAEHKRLQEKANDPAHQEKLKAARKAHIEATKRGK